MNERALKIYQSTFLVELTKDNSIENTYGFIVNEGTESEPKLIHYIQGDVTANGISHVKMIFNYYHNDQPMERSVSGMKSSFAASCENPKSLIKPFIVRHLGYNLLFLC